MVTVIDFLTELVFSVVDLVVIFVTEVALRDPLAFVSFAVGGLLTTVSVGVLGYLALGALGYEFGVNDPARRRRPPRSPDEGH